MSSLQSKNQHPNLLSPFHSDVSSCLLVTYLSISTLRGHCPGSTLKATCTLGWNDCAGKSDSMSFSVVGPILCLSRILAKSSGIWKVVTKRQTYVWNHQTSLCFTSTHRRTVLSPGLSAEATSLDLREKSNRHQMQNRKEDLFSFCNKLLWFSNIVMMAQKQPPLSFTITHLTMRAGTDLALRSSVLFPALLQPLGVIVDKPLSLVHGLPRSRKGAGFPCLPGVLWDQESVVAGKNLVKMVIKGLWILQERTNRSGHLYMKLLFTPYLGQTCPQFFWSEPPTHISSGVRKHRVKQLTISRFGQIFWAEIWTKQKVYISKNWLKLNHVIYSHK